jgi:cobalt-zinc-cadmium efflux system outer membrane protein
MDQPYARIATFLACMFCSAGLASSTLAADPELHNGHIPPSSPPATAPTALNLADLERIALQRNPTLVQAAARIDMSKGKALQAGLYPNPTIGYQGELIGVQGTAGEFQGGFIRQEIVTAGKLRLSRAKYQQETYQAEIQATAQQLRVVNGIHMAFYDVLAAQRLIDIHRELLKNAEDAVKTTEQLVNVGQANEPDLLQAQIEAQRARVSLGNAEKRYRRDWEHLVTLLGAPELPPGPLAGQLEPEGPALEWESALCKVLQESPELEFVRAEVVRDQITVKREQVEPIPNVVVQGGAGYDAQIGERGAVANVQVGIRLPLFDRNQGTIKQAQADVTRVELLLRRRLADAFHHYDTARDSAKDYRENTLPKARRAFELYMDYFKKRRATWPQVLVAERAYFQYQEEYLSTLVELRRAEVEIRGLLVVDGLTQPPAPTPQGHIESTPKPR